MTEWLLAFDRRMERQKRRVILFMDNATSHCDAALNNVKIIFLPPNTTSRCLPLDQGIIQNFKVFYRQKVLRNILSRMDNVQSGYELAKSINVLDAILWISSALKQVTSTTISNCFKKAGFILNDSGAIDNGVEESNLKEREHELQSLVEEFGGSEGYANIDDALFTESTSTSVSELIQEHNQERSGDNVENGHQDEDDKTEPDYPPLSSKQAVEEVRKLKHYFLAKSDEEGLSLTLAVETHIEKTIINDSLVQKKIHDYFKPTFQNA